MRRHLRSVFRLFRRLLRWWPYALGLAVIALIYWAWPGTATLTVGPETTHLTAPLDVDGFVDYSAALNERYGKGIDPAHNAVVGLWKAIGPKLERGGYSPRYFEALQSAPPAEADTYFVSWKRNVELNYWDIMPPGPPQPPERDIFGQDIYDPRPETAWQKYFDQSRQWPWKAASKPEIARWLDLNKSPLSLVREASKETRFYDPVGPFNAHVKGRVISDSLPVADRGVDFGGALKCRAMLHLGEKRYEEAWQDLMTCQRLGRLFCQGSTVRHVRVGLYLIDQSDAGLLILLSEAGGKFDPRWLKEYATLTPIPSMEGVFDTGLRYELLTSLTNEYLDYPARNLLKPSFWDALCTHSMDWDIVFRRCNQIVDRCVQITAMTDSAEKQRAYDQLSSEIQREFNRCGLISPREKYRLSRYSLGESQSAFLHQMMWSLMGDLVFLGDGTRQRTNIVQIALALAAHHAEKGMYPKSLLDLAPRYLQKIPDDFFTGKPLIYESSKQGYSLNRAVESEGDDDDQEVEGKGLIIRMPMQKPAAVEE